MNDSSAEFQALFIANPHPMWVYDRETLFFLEVNNVAVARYGYSRAEFLAMKITEIRPQEDVARVLADVRARHRGPDFAGQWRHRTKGGQIIDVEIVSHELAFAGRPAALVVAQDITERKRAEETVRESEQRFRHLADTAPVMIWMAGTDTERGYFNKPWLDFTGRAMAQETGNGWAAGVHPDDLPRCLNIYRTAFQARETFEMEYRLRRADGQYRWVLDIGTARYQTDGTFLGYIGSCIDVTERKEAQQTVREQESRQRAFLKEVLASVTEGKLRLCDTSAELPARLTPAQEPIAITQSALQAMRHSARDAALKQGFSAERVQELETAVGEAAMNAFVHAGGGTGQVYADANGSVQVWIEDTGTGIDMRSLPRATLERGFTTAGSLGHGFWLMLQMADELWLLTGAAGTTVVIQQHKTPPLPAWLFG